MYSFTKQTHKHRKQTYGHQREKWEQGMGKIRSFIPIPKKGNAKQCPKNNTIALISHASKFMLKIPQARLQQLVNQELPDVQARFRRQRNQRSN